MHLYSEITNILITKSNEMLCLLFTKCSAPALCISYILAISITPHFIPVISAAQLDCHELNQLAYFLLSPNCTPVDW